VIRGIYTAASGMRLQLDMVDIYANNLANAQTNGYKRNEIVAQAFPDLLIQMAGSNGQPGHLGQGVRPVDVVQDMHAGIMQQTGNVMHAAIEGDGFFVTRQDTPAAPGRPATSQYQQTRNGEFSINSQQQLVTSDGKAFMDINNQPIKLSPQTVDNLDQNMIIRQDGSVVERLGGVDRVAGKLKIAMVRHVEGMNPNMAGKDSSMEMTKDLDKAPKVFQRYLEESNISVVSEMVSLMTSSKAYDTSQKAIQSQDKMLDKVINEVGRPG